MSDPAAAAAAAPVPVHYAPAAVDSSMPVASAPPAAAAPAAAAAPVFLNGGPLTGPEMRMVREGATPEQVSAARAEYLAKKNDREIASLAKRAAMEEKMAALKEKNALFKAETELKAEAAKIAAIEREGAAAERRAAAMERSAASQEMRNAGLAKIAAQEAMRQQNIARIHAAGGPPQMGAAPQVMPQAGYGAPQVMPQAVYSAPAAGALSPVGYAQQPAGYGLGLALDHQQLAPGGPIPEGMHEAYESSYAQTPQYLPLVMPPSLAKVGRMDKRVYEDPHSPLSQLKGAFDGDPNEACKEKDVDKAQWQPDSAASQCQRCSAKFSLFKRKHHCRRCFLLVCGDCSKTRQILPETLRDRDAAKRVCTHCEYVRPTGAEQMLNPYAAVEGSVPAGAGDNGANNGYGSRTVKAKTLYTAEIPPEYAPDALLSGSNRWASAPGMSWPTQVPGAAPGSMHFIVGTQFPIARETDQVTLHAAHAAQQKQMQQILDFWGSNENLSAQHNVHRALYVASQSINALPLKLQAALNCRKEVDLHRERVRALSLLPAGCDQAALATIHAHYTTELINFAQSCAVPAQLMVQQYLDSVAEYQNQLRLSNAERDAAAERFRRARAVAAASAPRVDVVYY